MLIIPDRQLFNRFLFPMYFRICMKYIDQALDRLKSKTLSNEEDLSLIERILISESDPNLACILALDLILVGIDTVTKTKIDMVGLGRESSETLPNQPMIRKIA